LAASATRRKSAVTGGRTSGRCQGESSRRSGGRERTTQVFVLDEVDKLGSDWRGDPSSALLEVLDPEQNNSFRDHYLDVSFDLSNVMFIATANLLDQIPAPLRDRMEILELSGYTDEDKVRIAQRYLVPKQVKAHGLAADAYEWTDAGVMAIIQNYTREAGVRNLEREVATVCRKIATRVAEGREVAREIGPEAVRDFLGRSRYFYEERAARTEQPGVAIGVGVTGVGGDIMFVEATRMAGKGSLTVTGQLGDVMKESATLRCRSSARGRGTCTSTPTSTGSRTSTSTFRREPSPRMVRRPGPR
jgi:ATP-dependent Lon protease